MPQHDLVINNASGAAVRADLNDALAALGSTMKGPNAPPAPIAGMLWLDDDTPSATVWTLKLYDGADWLSIGTFNVSTNTFTPANALPLAGGTLTGQLLAPAGSSSAPSYSFADDPDTGLFRVASNELGLSTNGLLRLRLNGSGQFGLNATPVNDLTVGGNGVTLANDFTPLMANAYFDGAWRYAGNGAAWGTGNNFGGPTNGFCIATAAVNSSGSAAALTWNVRLGVPQSGPITVSGGQTVTGDLEASGDLRFNSGYGSAAIAYGVRAWASVTIAAGVPTMDANGNFTSITDNGVGDFTFNFSNNMPNAHYAIAGSAVGLTNTAGVQPGLAVNTANGQPLLKSTSQVRIGLYRLDANAYADAATFSIMVVR